jgi:short-subunit dehydrogenase
MEGVADTLRQELHGSGIQVSLVEPGPILTRFRENSITLFEKHIKPDSSFHRAQYTVQMERLRKTGAAVPFTLPPEDVALKVVDALESKRAKARYRVTVPSVLFWYLKKVLPACVIDALVRKS